MAADGRVASQATQRIKLTLDPRRARDPDRKMLISGEDVDGER
ncbi:hypothetical protein [Streptomyces sp. NPDC096095]